MLKMRLDHEGAGDEPAEDHADDGQDRHQHVAQRVAQITSRSRRPLARAVRM